ncbi:hypothetical protein HAX54_041612, partial [Datura stramonium]|nr:hypothetical protein [Datura stramonium]
DQNQVLVVPAGDRRNIGGDPRIVAKMLMLYRILGEKLSIRCHTGVSQIVTREVQVKRGSGQWPKALHPDLCFNLRFAGEAAQ